MTFWRIFPFGLIVVGLIVTAGGVTRLGEEFETEPTEVKLEDVRGNSPNAEWLRITDGGAFIPGVVMHFEDENDVATGEPDEWYIPQISQSRLNVEMAARMFEKMPPPPQRLVLVKYSNDDYLKKYVHPRDLGMNETGYRVGPVEGTRMDPETMPVKLKNFIQIDMKMPIGMVVVLEGGEKPMQKKEAKLMAFGGAVAIGVGILIILIRFAMPSHDEDPYTPQQDYNDPDDQFFA